MNPSALIFVAFSLVLAVYGQQHQCSHQHLEGGLTVTTIVSTMPGGTPGARQMSSTSGQGGGILKNILGIRSVLGEKEIETIKSSWEMLKRKGDFAPKVFMRYLKSKPESQRLFPAFSHVPMSDLASNSDFLNQAYTCVSSLNHIIPHLESQYPTDCPAFTNLKDKYNEADIKKFGGIWLTTMQEEMGSRFTNTVRDAWKNAIMALSNYAAE